MLGPEGEKSGERIVPGKGTLVNFVPNMGLNVRRSPELTEPARNSSDIIGKSWAYQS